MQHPSGSLQHWYWWSERNQRFQFCWHYNNITLPAEGHFKVTCNSQQQTHDSDVALVPAERQLKVQRDRPLQQTDLDVVLLPAEGHIEAHNDRQQQQPDSVFANQRDEGHLHVISNRQVTTNCTSCWETFPGVRL